MERVLDLLFGIRWWHWLLGMSGVAGLYYLVAGVVLPYFKGVTDEHAEDAERQRQEEQDKQRLEARKARDAERKQYLKHIPSGPVEPVELPKALVRVRNRNFQVPQDRELVLGTRRGVDVPVMARGVSRDHAKIRPEPQGYVLYDLMSEAGTFVAGERIQRRLLADGDRIRIGPVEAIFSLAPGRGRR